MTLTKNAPRPTEEWDADLQDSRIIQDQKSCYPVNPRPVLSCNDRQKFEFGIAAFGFLLCRFGWAGLNCLREFYAIIAKEN